LLLAKWCTSSDRRKPLISLWTHFFDKWWDRPNFQFLPIRIVKFMSIRLRTVTPRRVRRNNEIKYRQHSSTSLIDMRCLRVPWFLYSFVMILVVRFQSDRTVVISYSVGLRTYHGINFILIGLLPCFIYFLFCLCIFYIFIIALVTLVLSTLHTSMFSPSHVWNPFFTIAVLMIDIVWHIYCENGDLWRSDFINHYFHNIHYLFRNMCVTVCKQQKKNITKQK
jgi:hypothetical protein